LPSCRDWCGARPYLQRAEHFQYGVTGDDDRIFLYLIAVPGSMPLFFVMVGLALVFGILLVMPIGSADMPVVMSLLNSYAGLASAATGFVLNNKV
jgi:NAD(P) transhydrogenase subunit beta